MLRSLRLRLGSKAAIGTAVFILVSIVVLTRLNTGSYSTGIVVSDNEPLHAFSTEKGWTGKYRWGYVTEAGEWAIKPRFAGVHPFVDGVAVVYVPYWRSIFGFRRALMDRSGSLLTRRGQNIILEPVDGLALAEKSADLGIVRFLFARRRFGFVNLEGEWVIPPKFEWAASFGDGLAPAILRFGPRELYGYIDTTGQWQFEPQFENAYSFREGVAVVKQFGIWHVLYPDGTNFPTPEEIVRVWHFSEGLLPVETRSGHIGFLDREGEWAIEPRFEFVPPYPEGYGFSEGLCVVGDGRHYGYIDTSGNIVLPMQFWGATQFSEGLAAVHGPGGWEYIDMEGNVVIEQRFIYAGKFHNGFARVNLSVNGSDVIDGLIDKAGKFLVPRSE